MFRSNFDIMSPEWTNVVFHDRNQAYGAYQLRKDNSYNINRSLIIAAGVFVFALSVPTIINKIKGYIPEAPEVVHRIDVTTIPVPPVEQPKIVEPVKQQQVVSHNDVTRFIPPVVRPDREVQEELANIKDLQKTDIGDKNIKGDPGADVNIDAKLSTEEVKGVTEAPADEKTIFVGVETEPMYPGGAAAFNKFLGSHIRYPNMAKENGIQGRVFVSFVVEIDGSLTDLKIIKDPGSGLGDEALRVLRTSQHWSPGIQNGRKVRVAYTVPVTFSLAE